MNSDKEKIYKINEGKLTGKAVFCLIICAFCCSFQFGWNIGVLNTPAGVIKNFINSTYHYEYAKYMRPGTLTFIWSLANGLFAFTGIFGGLASGYICDRYGRKKAMLLANSFVLVSGIACIISKSVHSYVTLLVGRAFAGLVTGLFSGIAPMYLVEIPPKNYRGITGVLNQLSIVIGLLISNIIGLPQLLGTDELWPYLLGMTLVPGVVLYLAAPFIVDSPKYVYLNKKDPEHTQNILNNLRGDSSAQYIVDEMRELDQEQTNQGEEVSYRDLFTKKHLYRPLICAIMVQFSQQLSGINAVVFYSTEIFTSIGLKEDTWAVYATIILSLIQVIMTFVSMALIEKAGRRLLLITGLSGMCFFSFGLAVSRILSVHYNAFKYISVVATVAYIIFFSIGPGAIPWFITAELFNSNARGKASSIAVLVNWVSNFTVTITFPFIEDAIGNYSFIIFGVLLLIFVIFIFFKIPETKGKTVEEISIHFNN